MALPRITAVRSRSRARPGKPKSSSASRLAAMAHFWLRSMASPTRGGMGSFQSKGAQGKSRTKPPILE